MAEPQSLERNVTLDGTHFKRPVAIGGLVLRLSDRLEQRGVLSATTHKIVSHFFHNDFGMTPGTMALGRDRADVHKYCNMTEFAAKWNRSNERYSSVVERYAPKTGNVSLRTIQQMFSVAIGEMSADSISGLYLQLLSVEELVECIAFSGVAASVRDHDRHQTVTFDPSSVHEPKLDMSALRVVTQRRGPVSKKGMWLVLVLYYGTDAPTAARHPECPGTRIAVCATEYSAAALVRILKPARVQRSETVAVQKLGYFITNTALVVSRDPAWATYDLRVLQSATADDERYSVAQAAIRAGDSRKRRYFQDVVDGGRVVMSYAPLPTDMSVP